MSICVLVTLLLRDALAVFYCPTCLHIHLNRVGPVCSNVFQVQRGGYDRCAKTSHRRVKMQVLHASVPHSIVCVMSCLYTASNSRPPWQTQP